MPYEAEKSSMNLTIGSGCESFLRRSKAERSRAPVFLLTGRSSDLMYHSLFEGSVPVEIVIVRYLHGSS
jgi:hypothetical protein